uniref:Uncharacterized protein n=1 Tax=Avena sativa TaxID=4498 RepID=A0ACD5YU30_AVESA
MRWPGGRWLLASMSSTRGISPSRSPTGVLLSCLSFSLILENGTAYFGGLIGRVANRIAGARFTLDGKAYRLIPNDGRNTLHGGHRGFSKVVWTVKEHVGGGSSPFITLYYHSFDGEQGFPGDLDVYVTYQISSPHVLSVHMNATARGKATPVNLAHHAYWNLGGHGSGSILGEKVRLFASRYTPVDAALIPTGRLAPVAGTPYDFRRPAAVGARMGGLLRRGVTGYDTNYAVDDGGEHGGLRRQLRRVAIVRDGASGRAMELWADQPGVQFYTANGLSGVREGRRGVRPVRRAVPGDAGVPRRREPPQLPVADRQAGAGVQP